MLLVFGVVDLVGEEAEFAELFVEIAEIADIEKIDLVSKDTDELSSSVRRDGSSEVREIHGVTTRLLYAMMEDDQNCQGPCAMLPSKLIARFLEHATPLLLSVPINYSSKIRRKGQSLSFPRLIE